MNNKYGGISIFLAVTFLSLIVFVMSIVEVTRYQILRAQAERMVISSTQSVLAGYDTALKNEYGIFARNPDYGDCFFVMPEFEGSGEKAILEDFRYYLNENVGQNPDTLYTSLVDRYVLRTGDDAYYDLAPLTLVASQVNELGTLVDVGSQDLSYAKQDMVDYMELRLPLIGLNSILETFDAAEKLGKTTTFVEGKNEQIEAAASIEDLYLELYRYMDGVTVDAKTMTLSVSNTRWVNRIKRSDQAFMLAYEGMALASGGTPDPEEPGLALTAYEEAYGQMLIAGEGLAEAYRDYQAYSKDLEDQKQDIEATKDTLEDLDEDIEKINKQISNKSEALSKAIDEDRAAIEMALEALKRERQELAEQIRSYGASLSQQKEHKSDLSKALKAEQALITSKMTTIDQGQAQIDRHKAVIAHLTETPDNYLLSNQEVASVIKDIQVKASAIESSIDGFIEASEKEEAAYIASTYEQSISELEQLKDSYGAGGDNQKTLKGNLTEIQKTVEANIGLLETVAEEVERLSRSGSILVGIFDQVGVDRTMLVDLEDISGVTGFYVTHLSTHAWGSKELPSQVTVALKEVGQASEAYRIAPLLDYSGFNQSQEALAEKSLFRDMVQGMQNFITTYDLNKISDKYNPADVQLPSGMISELVHMVASADNLTIDTNYNEEDYQGDGAPEDDQVYMEAGRSAGGDHKLLSDAKDQLLLNEYAIGMFRSYPDKEREEESLAGYALKDHPYETELEYIYTGISDSDQALMNVALQIFAVRTAFNVVHLSTDAVKRSFIMKVASAIAGPISAGLLTIVVAMFVGLLWATVESLVDLDRLLSGDKVPLLKTSASWFTSPEGLVNLSINTVTTLAIDYTDRFVDAVSDKTQEKLNLLKGKVTDTTAQLVDQELHQLYEQVELVTDGAVDAFDQVYYQALDAVLLSYREGKGAIHASDFLSETAPGYPLLVEGIDTLEQALDGGVEKSYVELMRAKNQVIEQQEAKMTQVKNKIRATIKDELNAGVDQLFEDMNGEVDALAAEGKKASADLIKKKLEAYRKTLHEKTDSYTKDIKAKGAKTDASMLIPSIDYEMYLRLFMIADSGHLDHRVARMLDLIDYNLVYGQKGAVTSEDLKLKDYLVSFEGQAQFEVDYLFLDLPLSAIKTKVQDQFFTIKAKAVNGYEQ